MTDTNERVVEIYQDWEGWFVKLSATTVYGPFRSKKAAKLWGRTR